MRVRISYGIELEDIPADVERRAVSAIQDLKDTTEQLSKAVGLIAEVDGDYKLVISMLDKVRMRLTNSDLIITDIQAILEGLQNYHNGEKNVSERRPSVDPSGDTTTSPENNGEG
jgi:hypothetical protein